MVTNPRSVISDRTNLTLVRNDGRKKLKHTHTLMRRFISTMFALALLALVLRFMTPASRNTRVQASHPNVQGTPDELRLGSVQMSKPVTGEALYLGGVVTNAGKDSITGAAVEVNFRDARGKLVSSVQKPIAGMAHGGTDLVGNEFARNPILPNEMRLFRVAVEQVPVTWNRQVPELKIVAVKAQ